MSVMLSGVRTAVETNCSMRCMTLAPARGLAALEAGNAPCRIAGSQLRDWGASNEPNHRNDDASVSLDTRTDLRVVWSGHVRAQRFKKLQFLSLGDFAAGADSYKCQVGSGRKAGVVSNQGRCRNGGKPRLGTGP